MIKVHVIEWKTGKIVNKIAVKGAARTSDRRVEQVERGLLINMDRDRYGTRAVEEDE
jgi:hypothetical protein